MKEILPYLVAVETILLAVMAWMRFKPTDRAKVGGIDAQSAKTLAEAQKIKSEADILITDAAMRLADRISLDCDIARKEVIKLQEIVDEMKVIIEKAKLDHSAEVAALNEKLKAVERLLEIKKRHCLENKAKVGRLQEILMKRNNGMTQEEVYELSEQLRLISLDAEEIQKLRDEADTIIKT